MQAISLYAWGKLKGNVNSGNLSGYGYCCQCKQCFHIGLYKKLQCGSNCRFCIAKLVDGDHFIMRECQPIQKFVDDGLQVSNLVQFVLCKQIVGFYYLASIMTAKYVAVY